MKGEAIMEKKFLIDLGPIDQIPIGQGQCFILNEEEIAVFRPRSGGVFALQNQCPHRKGPLSEGVVGGGKVICPLHGQKFDLLTGQGGEKQECVKTFKIWEKDGEIMIEYNFSAGKTLAALSASCVSGGQT